MKKIFVVLAIIAFGFLGMMYLTSADKASNKRDEVVDIRKVETQKVVYDDIVLSIKGNGVIESKQSLDIISEATGKVLYAKNNLKNGTYFTKGEVILKVDSREVESESYRPRTDLFQWPIAAFALLTLLYHGGLFLSRRREIQHG